MSTTPLPAPRSRLSERDCDLDAFRALVEQSTDPPATRGPPPWSTTSPSTTRGNCATTRGRRPNSSTPSRTAPHRRPQGRLPGHVVVDRATAVFDALIEEQRASGATAGDHFAAPGANDRVWNALEKAALHDPDTFADYYANDVLALVARAWLGPGYQVTSQINVVNPGGAAQTAHRDYHLGFLSPRRRRPTRRTCTASPPSSRSRARSPTATCPWSRGRRCTCRTPRSTSRVIWPGGSPSSGPASRSATCSCPSPRATRSSSTRRCSTRRAPTAPPASAAWPTCCRSRPRSAARWRAWTGRRW